VIPLKDRVPRRTFPFVTLVLIIVNALVFFHELALTPRQLNAFVQMYGLVPSHIQAALTVGRISLLAAFLPLLTCMFLHAGWLHIIGNMWVLWIFGDNVEDQLGHIPFLFFYLICGIGSGVAQVVFSWGSHVPSVGASGAISGVLAAFLIFFPAARVLTLVPLLIIWFTADIPALIFIGLWFVVQFLSGMNSIGTRDMTGVAWWAHVGGFLLGLVLAWGERPRRSRPAHHG
jgi:membrane associated rhomboid family serine protease